MPVTPPRQPGSQGTGLRQTARRTLDVVPMSAVLPFRGTGTPADSMARELGAGSVVAGTLRAEPDGLRLEIRLLDGASGSEHGRVRLLRDWHDLQEGAPVLVEELAGFLRSRMGDAIRGRASEQEAETRGG